MKFITYLSVVFLVLSCTSTIQEKKKQRFIMQEISHTSDSIHERFVYRMNDDSKLIETTWKQALINKYIGGILKERVIEETTENLTYEALSDDSLFYRFKVLCQGEDRLYIKDGQGLFFLDKTKTDSSIFHDVYLFQPYFIDKIEISTFSMIQDSIRFEIKNQKIDNLNFLIEQKNSDPTFLIVNQTPFGSESITTFRDTFSLEY